MPIATRRHNDLSQKGVVIINKISLLFYVFLIVRSFFFTLSFSPKFTICSRLLFFATPANEAKTSLKVRYPFLKCMVNIHWVQINVVQQYFYYKLKGISENHFKKN